ncbi:hypothetical protein M8J76_011941 [Diaphorina citri]|nr:hypothetical protein M8J75_013134 [Diaphorina citri]KAI5722679.1 hypothetical protein M8J76_011941 [Diaphorina citri]
MTAGVPQGSILGPTLWNLLYNGVLELPRPDGVTFIAYADDLAVVILAKTEIDIETKASDTLGMIKVIAPEKSEATLLVDRKEYNPFKIQMGNVVILQKDHLKYLDIILDSKVSFLPHIKYVAAKAEKLTTSLMRITPRLGGAGENKRRVLQRCTESILLYGAPIWAIST